MIEESKLEDMDEILEVVNTSNRTAYKEIIPKEYFRDQVTTKKELLADFERMTFYSFKYKEKIVGVIALHVEGGKIGRFRYMYILPGKNEESI